MTVARGIRLDMKRAVAVTVVGLAGAVAALALVLQLAGSSDAIDVQLGDPDFRGIQAANLAVEISEHGPVPFPDLVGNELPIWVGHSGTDPTMGWVAVSARVPGSADCLVQWDKEAKHFINGCDPTTTWPADGTGLMHLKWTVITGELRIDVARFADGVSPGP
ncbi:MAG: hypothetical protein P8M16_03315 [Acidimicrobiales bacterium]|nr:hypothetical protein [Acidimicrobiales bacterium]